MGFEHRIMGFEHSERIETTASSDKLAENTVRFVDKTEAYGKLISGTIKSKRHFHWERLLGNVVLSSSNGITKKKLKLIIDELIEVYNQMEE